MHSLILLLLLLPLTLANTLAGGPAIVPIPANCTSTSIHLQPPSDTNFTLNDPFVASNRVYEFILEPDNWAGTEAELLLECQEQCYGYGDDGDCVAVLFAENVSGTAYGYPVTGYGCAMFGVGIDEKDLQETADGSYANALALNRWCPSPRCTEQPDGSCT